MAQSLSIKQAQKLVLNSQRVLSPSRLGKAIDVTLDVVNHLGYIQIDTISVIARAHHHTLWNRNPRYKPLQLNRLLAQRSVFEYWAHAAAYLPMEDYRFYLPRMQEVRGDRGGWLQSDPSVKKKVYGRIREEGPLMVKDFADPRSGRPGMWDWKPAKIALEQLFMEGRLMTTRRQGFHKVYDLRERVLPSTVDTRMPSQREYAEYLITTYLRANGLGQVPEFVYLRKGVRPMVQKVSDEMLEQGTLLVVNIQGESWLMLSDAASLLQKPLARSQLKILSPFDNMVIQRKRILKLFNFDYQIECYVPSKKRQYGYFCLPILWQGRIIARMDCKADRDQGVFELRSLHFEPHKFDLEKFAAALLKSLKAFAIFNACPEIKIGNLSNPNLSMLLQEKQ